MDKVSIIVPVYKVEEFLDNCIQSIVNQSYKNLEIILVDDGSPDNCGKICDDWAKKDDRIIVLHKQNGGLSDARNAGLEIITGEYFTYIDSDDYVDKDYIKVLKDGMDKYNAELTISSFSRFPSVTNDFCSDINYTLLDGKTAMYRIVNWFKDYVMVWSKMYKSEVFKHLRFKKGKNNEDEFYITEVYHIAKVVVHTPTETYFYRVNPNSITKVDFNPSKLSSIEALEFRDNFLVENNYLELIARNRKTLLFAIINMYYEAKKAGYKKEKKILKEKFKYWYKQDLTNIDRKDKIKLFIFKVCPFCFKCLFCISRRRKCKKK